MQNKYIASQYYMTYIITLKNIFIKQKSGIIFNKGTMQLQMESKYKNRK